MWLQGCQASGPSSVKLDPRRHDARPQPLLPPCGRQQWLGAGGAVSVGGFELPYAGFVGLQLVAFDVDAGHDAVEPAW